MTSVPQAAGPALQNTTPRSLMLPRTPAWCALAVLLEHQQEYPEGPLCEALRTQCKVDCMSICQPSWCPLHSTKLPLMPSDAAHAGARAAHAVRVHAGRRLRGPRRLAPAPGGAAPGPRVRAAERCAVPKGPHGALLPTPHPGTPLLLAEMPAYSAGSLELVLRASIVLMLGG